MTAAPHSPTTTDTEDVGIGIAEMAESSGLTQDTPRWYEREGLISDCDGLAVIPPSVNEHRSIHVDSHS